jgi:hypothetical protein
MHHKTHQSVRVTLRPSRIGAALAIVVHALAALAALDAPDPWLAALLLLVVAASAAATTRGLRQCARADGARAIERDGAGRWWLETCAGERLEVALEGVPLVTPPLVAVSLRAAGRRWHLALFPDSAGTHELRRLRAVLRTAA